jgi:hypothetical protein
MKINFYVGPRQSGKTQRALERYSEEPESSVLFVHNSKNATMLKDVMNKMGIENPVIRSAEQLGSLKEATSIPNPRLKDKKIIICDEYLFWGERAKARFFEFLQNHPNVETVVVYTSLDKFYDLKPSTEIEKYVYEKSIQEDPYNLIYKSDKIIPMAFTYYMWNRDSHIDDRVLEVSRLK